MRLRLFLFFVFVSIAYFGVHKYKSSNIENENALKSDKYIMAKISQKKAGSSKVETPEIYTYIQKQLRTSNDQKAPSYGSNYLINEIGDSKKAGKYIKSGDAVFTERGPANVAGRTRAIIVYDKDPTRNTWLAASVSGGIWKTDDAGQTWIHKTQELPNLGTCTMASSISNPDVVYAGTGEHFTNDIDGAGMFKSLNFGESWVQIVNPETYPDFKNVSRIIADPNDENIVVATTRNTVWGDSLSAAVYKTIDGGANWYKTLSSNSDRYDDLNYNPSNFLTQYIAVDGQGVLKSTDGGETWIDKSFGLQPSGRIEIDVSPVDTNVLWASIEGTQSGSFSDLYVSTDGAESWNLAVGATQADNVDFLGGQGWYDNIITAHPFRADQVYVGGINLWKFALDGSEFENTVFNFDEIDTRDFLSFVNGNFLGGGIDFGDNIAEEDITSLEIRFGQGTQMAHRFTVNQRGPGVPARDYEYTDYVEVPFQVWDTDNERQLMVSFRDQQENGVWDLLSLNTNAPNQDDSREYIFVHNVDYGQQSDSLIALNGGHEYLNMYFMWPYLTDGATFDADNLPESMLSINKFEVTGLGRINTNISDAYFQFDNRNTFSSFNFENNLGMHPDQHNIIPLVEPGDNLFRLLIANDGGMYVSRKSGNPGATDDSFIYSGHGFNTTQFYSADKAPGVDRYIGGMQDNSTWFTPSNAIRTDASTDYEFAFGGDGFEALWNNRDDRLILGSIQFNSFQKSTDGGQSWRNATSGLLDVGQGSGPFISRLANSKSFPDRVFTLGSRGVWVSDDFGDNWVSIPIASGLWSFNNSADVEVSLADFNTIWAGGRLDENSRLFVSNDGGNTFNPVSYYQDTEMGFVSGIATHPIDPNIAYSIFSFSGKPKILITTDLGETWSDITGFDNSQNGKSTRGFPDVAVNTLFVFPNDTNRMWAGTEIGIVETKDNGESWALIDCPLGAVNIYDFMLQDDQLVIATYGRGIWTAEVEGLESLSVFPPVITGASVSPSGSITVDAKFNQEFDSTRVFFNGTLLDITIGDNIIGTESFNLSVDDILENNTIELISYINEIGYSSNIFSLDIFIPEIPVEEYSNRFEETNSQNDFFGAGFTVRLAPDFVSQAIHSDHPYFDNRDITYTLKTPIEITKNQLFSYRDVAIVEPGEEGTAFGNIEFYDYVVVEGSLDGINWSPLMDGYDARSSTAWRNAFESSSIGTSEMFVYHEMSLSDIYDIGDVIFIRFRLSADPAIFGWGWAIDDVNVEKVNTTAIIEVETDELSIYPNPASDFVNIEMSASLEIEAIELFDFTGRAITKIIKPNGDSRLRIETSNLQKGNYILIFSTDEDQIIKKLTIL